MATIGEQLTSPQSGWTRFNCDFESITFSDGWSLSTGMGSYNGNDKRTTSSDKTIEFKFYGSGMRLIAPINNDLSTSVKIEIDDNIVETYSQRNSSLQWQTIVYEKTNMELKEHSVKITTLTSGSYGLSIFDCVDIEDGHICKSDCNHATIPSISHKNASLTYTLPMATTKKIKAKSNDKRVGLLGLANDDENFGDLYVVGKDGKSHLTKSGIKSEILFEGVANNTGVYNLGKSVSTHKFLSIYGDIANGSYSYSMLIAVEELKAKDYIFEIYEQNYLVIRLISDNEIEVKSKNNAGHYDGRITKIIGIY